MYYYHPLNVCIYLCLIILFLPFKAIAQHKEPVGATDSQYIEVAREIMNTATNCALITLDAEGRPRVRVMDPFIPEENLTIWLATNPRSRKVTQIQNDPRVTLYYLDNSASGYVMIHGSAVLVDDQAQKESHWKDAWEAFYPNYPDDYLLIKVAPEWMEVVSYTHGIVGDSITWTPPVVFIKR